METFVADLRTTDEDQEMLMNKLHEDEKKILQTLIVPASVIDIEANENKEQLYLVEIPNFWLRNMVYLTVSGLGTLGLLLELIILKYDLVNMQYFILSLIFPALGALLLSSYPSAKHAFVAITDKRLYVYSKPNRFNVFSISSDDPSKHVLIINLENVLDVINRRNWLLGYRELEIQRKSDTVFHVTSRSQQSGFKTEFIDGFYADDLKRIETALVQLSRVCRERSEQEGVPAVGDLTTNPKLKKTIIDRLGDKFADKPTK